MMVKKLFLICFVLLLIISPTWATNYYVDSTCGEAGGDGTTTDCDGGADDVFVTLASAQAAITGDQSDNSILLARGSLFRETFTFGANGTSGHQFTLSAYGAGDLPKIYGSTEISTWETTGSNLWTATSAADPESLWFVNTDGSIVWGEDMAAATPDTEYQWIYAGTTVTVYAATDPDSRYTSIEKPTRLQSVNINGKSYVTISYLDISFNGAATSDEAAAIYQGPGPNPGTNGIIVEYNKTHHNGKLSMSPKWTLRAGDCPAKHK